MNRMRRPLRQKFLLLFLMSTALLPHIYLFFLFFTVRRLRFCRARRQLQVSGFIITGSRFRVKLELSYVAALLGSEEVGLVVVRESGIWKWVGRDGKLIEKGWGEACGVLMGRLRARGEGQA